MKALKAPALSHKRQPDDQCGVYAVNVKVYVWRVLHIQYPVANEFCTFQKQNNLFSIVIKKIPQLLSSVDACFMLFCHICNELCV